MHYPFEPGLIRKPDKYATGLTPAGGLSARDRDWALKFYPAADAGSLPFLSPLQSVPLKLQPGHPAGFAFQPEETRSFEFRTFGPSDTAMALFAPGAAEPLAQDDDSGEGRNAYFKVPLQAGKRYVLRIRLQFAETGQDTAVMAW
jgi:hypothetical protein